MSGSSARAAAGASNRSPGPGRPTRAQARLRQLELLDRSLDLFLEHGFEGTTMEGIAAALRMAKRTVYAYYPDKKTLFKAALQRAIDEWIVPVEELAAAESDDLEQTLLSIGRILVDNILTPAGMRLLRITNAEAGRMPEISAYTYRQGTGPTLAYLEDLFRRRVPDADPEAAALAFLYLVVDGPASQSAWGIPLEAERVSANTRYCVRLFLHGVQAAGRSQPVGGDKP